MNWCRHIPDKTSKPDEIVAGDLNLSLMNLLGRYGGDDVFHLHRDSDVPIITVGWKNDRVSDHMVRHFAVPWIHFARFESCLADATPVISPGVHVGNRHTAMKDRLARRGGRASWQGHTVTELFIAQRATAYWLRLPDRHSFPQSELVGILERILAHRPAWISRRLGHTEDFRRRQSERGRKGG